MEFKNCALCGLKIDDSNFGSTIEVDEKMVCNNCYKKHLNIIIGHIEQFRKGKDFDNILKLRQKLLEVSGKMGNLNDNATGTHVESPVEYEEYNVSGLQLFLIDFERTFVEELIRDYGEKDKQPLFEELSNLQKQISLGSYK